MLELCKDLAFMGDESCKIISVQFNGRFMLLSLLIIYQRDLITRLHINII
jgi:hypothetical protein